MCKARADHAARMLSHVSSAVMPRLVRGIQYSRGVTIQAPTPLEYWLARSRLRQGFDAAYKLKGAPEL